MNRPGFRPALSFWRNELCPTWQGFAYVAFITDGYSRRNVGWNAAPTLKADILPLQALDMAAFAAGGNLTTPTHHSDHGSKDMAMIYTDRIVELGVIPSTGTVGDSDDNAIAEAINTLDKSELIRARGPWRTAPQVELAVLEWVWWWNNQRLHFRSRLQHPSRGRTEALRSNRITLESDRFPREHLGTKPRAIQLLLVNQT